MTDLPELNNPLIKEWAHHTMEKRKGHKVHNFWAQFEFGGIFAKQIVFHCSGDDNQPNELIYMDTFQIPAEDLTETIREYQLSKILS
jgi:hypothetical protein